MIHVPPPKSSDPPFVVEVFQEQEPGRKFRPTARIVLSATIEQLAQAIGPEALGILTVIVSTVTANGTISPNARTLQRALGLLARPRLLRLARRSSWRGQPILLIAKTAAGMETFRPSSAVLGRREAPPALTAPPTGGAPRVRELIVAASRNQYAKDRETVEREIVASMGWPSPEEMEETRNARPKEPTNLTERWAVNRLIREKVDASLAIKLVKDYGHEKVLQQIRWLDQRHAKNRKRFIVGAIMRNYPPPSQQEASE